MPMKILIGNLLDIPLGVILHQVNCRGATGGLAGALRQRFPAQFDLYAQQCQRLAAQQLAGTALVGEALRGPYIAHVFGQVEPGHNTDMGLVTAALQDLAEQIDSHHALAAMPLYAPYKMGCGLGGGDWAKYSALLELFFPEITIVQRIEDAHEPQT